jgi:transcriptional regulator of acetoin/glycerol metabolism
MSRVASTPEAVAQARQLFFEEGTLPRGLVPDAVLRSWQRCLDDGRTAAEAMEFNPVRRNVVLEWQERSRQLIVAAEPAMASLARAMTGTGYGILLTDASGACVAVHGPIDHCGVLLRRALRPGVDLSERAIGTSAMSAAMSEGKPIGVFGAEHFFSQNQTFQCVAAPIFDAQGALAGSIDITRDSPHPHFGVLALMLDCAAAIETSLFLQTPAHLTIGLRWRADASDQFSPAIISFGKDGEVQALSRAARRLLGIGATVTTLSYAHLFHGSYAQFVDRAAASRGPVQLTLQSGLHLFANILFYKRRESAAFEGGAPDRLVRQTTTPEFGDTAIHLAMQRAVRAVNAGLPVLIQGETGTGKEVAALALHANSPRADGPFIAINCGALPRDLIEGELFGYADGAFTGARRGGAKGRIEEADGGTLFLDEIGDMPPDLQTRLLRVLESREVTRLGESAPRRLDIQLLSATNQDLDALVDDKRFRSDLFFRLNGFQLLLPPVRLRNDISALIEALRCEEGIDAQRLTPDSRAALEAYSWPGNARQLRTALRFAKAMAEDREPIDLSHLPDAVTRLTPVRAPDAPAPRPAGQLVATKPLKELTSEVINNALREAGGNITCASERLGISRSTLHRWLNKQ